MFCLKPQTLTTNISQQPNYIPHSLRVGWGNYITHSLRVGWGNYITHSLRVGWGLIYSKYTFQTTLIKLDQLLSMKLHAAAVMHFSHNIHVLYI